MVRRSEPDTIDVMRNSTSMCSSLSVDKVDDFSSPFASGGGAAGGGAYTDYMRAFSFDSMITPHTADAKGHGFKTVEGNKPPVPSGHGRFWIRLLLLSKN